MLSEVEEPRALDVLNALSEEGAVVMQELVPVMLV